MSANYFTSIPTGSQATAALFNARLGDLDEAISDLTGNVVDIVAMRLKEWTQAEAFELLTVTYHGTYLHVVSSATVRWPDGSGGAFTATAINTTWEAVDGYTITHSVSGKTVTQATVTRNANGDVTTKPALTVS